MIDRKIDKKTSELLVTIDIEGQKWEDLLKEANEDLLKKVQVKGFRKGKVPKDIAMKHISQPEIFTRAITKGASEAVKEAGKNIGDVMILDAPTYKVESVDKAKAVITFVYPIYPEFKIDKYKGLGIAYKVEGDVKEAVEQEIKRIEDMSINFEEKSGAIAKGDNVIFDFEGFVDGKPFEGGKAEKFKLEIGSNSFIPGFEDAMVGLKSGEEKDINVTFPKEYHSKELQNKPATFKVKIHNIQIKKAAKLDDKKVVELKIPNVTNIKELRVYLNQVFEMQNEQRARAKFQREIFDKILENVEISIPTQLLARETLAISKQTEDRMKQQGFSVDQYLKMTGMKKEQMAAEFRKQAESRLKDAFVFAEIAKLEKIELVDADYEVEYIKLAKVYNNTIEGIKGTITKEQMQIPMTNDRVIDLLIAENK